VGLIGKSDQISAKSALRVLLIEDSIDDADLTLEELRSSGYVVDYLRVDNAAALHEVLSVRSFDVALCDYSMPGFDALGALAIVKEHRLDLPFIVVSGAIGEATAVAAMRAGAHDFLIKGQFARLVPVIEREIREARVRAERASMQQQLLLSDRLVQIGTLAAGVAHEINNPLAYVIGNIVYAIDELSSGMMDLTSVMGALRQALEGSERIRATTADLRVFSRSDDDEVQRVDLQRVLESAISMAWNQIRHRARLSKDIADLPPLAANENRLGQVFLNLLMNAAQAIPEGDASKHEIRVSAHVVDDQIEIAISDSGVGIPNEVRDHLFQPFYTTKPKGMGTGLGLSICQKIVCDYDGTISAYPNDDRGTTFRVRLPFGGAVPSQKPPLPVREHAHRRGRILVIDDEPGIVDIVTRVLRQDHEAIGMVGAHDALQWLAHDGEFDVILCDLMMPDMSGAEFYQVLEQSAPQLLDRIVFLSGGAFTASAHQFLARIKNLRLEKPFDPNSLRVAVHEQLALLDERRANANSA
jgi:signal transduction histidine kinase